MPKVELAEIYGLQYDRNDDRDRIAVLSDQVIEYEVMLPDDETVVVGISRDSTWSHRAWKAAKGIKHDLLADTSLEVTRTYGLEHPAVPFISQRATVIVDRSGDVAFVEVQEATPEERDWESIQEALAQLD